MTVNSERGSRVGVHIFIVDSLSDEDKAKRSKSLHSMGVTELFEDGTISIDMPICKGIGCQLCIKACPTRALYWSAWPGEIRIIRELCVFCAACVWICTVDDCIKVRRKRTNGAIERFSNPRAVQKLLCNINLKKRAERVRTRVNSNKELFPF